MYNRLKVGKQLTLDQKKERPKLCDAGHDERGQGGGKKIDGKEAGRGRLTWWKKVWRGTHRGIPG